MSQAPSVSAQVGRGVATMVARYAVVTPLSLLASIVLARLLAPADFGTFVSVSVLINGMGGLFELGMMSVLIQQPEAPTVREQRAVFTAYALMYGAIAAGVAAAAPWLAEAFRLPAEGVPMLRAMAALFVLAVLGCVPTLKLEREMRFGAYAGLDVANVLVEKGVSIAFAFAGHGAWSFVWGALASMAVRMALLSWVAPWSFGLVFDRRLIGGYLAKGAWFQGVNLVSLARDNLNTLMGGPFFGPRAVGLLNWGQNLPAMVAGNGATIFQKVFFPAFARLHDQPEARTALLATGLRGLVLVVFPLLAALPALGEPLVVHLYGEAWREALPALGCFALRAAAGTLLTPIIWYLNATGRVRAGFQAMLAWIATEWGLALALLPQAGFTGIAFGAAAGSLAAAVGLWVLVRREARLSAWRVLGPGAALAVAVGALAAALAPLATSLPALVAVSVAVGAAWALAAAGVEREALRAFVVRRRRTAA